MPRLSLLDAATGRAIARRSYVRDEIPVERVTADAATNGIVVSGIVDDTSAVAWRDTGIRLDAAGDLVTELWRSQVLHTRPALAADGAIAFGTQAPSVPDGEIMLRLRDGTTHQLLAAGLTRSVAFTADGDVVAVLWGPPHPDFTTPEWWGMWLLRLGRDGTLRWRRTIDTTTTRSPQLAIARDGTIVFTLRPEEPAAPIAASWGEAVVSGVYSLLVLSATPAGEPRWIRALGDASTGYSAAIDPDRGVALVSLSPGACPALRAEMLALDGASQWKHDFACASGTLASASPVVGRGGPLLIAGFLDGAFDFGNGPLTSPPGGGPFVVRVAPPSQSR
jgi:hypothetical protein